MPNKRLVNLTGQAKRTVQATVRALQAAEQAQREMTTDAGRIGRYLTDDFSWSFLYELAPMQLCILVLMAAGQLEKVKEVVKSAEDPSEAVLALIEAEMADDTPLEWSGGSGGEFTEEEVIALLIALLRSLMCQSLYGSYMPELIARARAGDDDAFFNVLKVDRTAITCPSMAVLAARRLSKAELLGQKRFLARFSSAMKGKPPKTLKANRKVRITLQYLQELGLMKGQTVSKDDIAFIQEVSGYSKQAGAERGLAQFVWRWRSSKDASTQNPLNGVVAPASP